MQVGSLQIYGNASQTATTFFQVARGTVAQRPTAASGMIRFNTDTNRLEHTNGSTSAWANVGVGDGSVTSVTLATGSSGLSISNATVTTTGTITLSLAGELAGLNALSATGIVARTGTGTYSPRTLTAASAAGLQGINISNGDGVAGAPTIGLSLSGLTAAGSVSSTDQVIVYNGTNNVRATVSQLSAAIVGVVRASRGSFTNTNLTSGSYSFTHNLGQKYVASVLIYDNNDLVIQPDNILPISTSTVSIDLTSYGSLAGTWNIVVSA
jgi:hypothetical protein